VYERKSCCFTSRERERGKKKKIYVFKSEKGERGEKL
jgi:hypothetical protein